MTTDREPLPEDEQTIDLGNEPTVVEGPPPEDAEALATPLEPEREPEPEPDRHATFDQGDSWDERWSDIQVGFVDDPQRSVSQADELVTEVLDEVTGLLRQERADMEERWHGDGEPSTENLRQTLQDYRALFDRLLAA